ncbi:MAG: SDR family NAD(P)-dependent oxidoreductase, partial [Gammaproteobacteria bacterium]
MTPRLNWLPQSYAPRAGELRERVIIVTGASEGLGRDTARRLAASGATIVALARTVPKLESLYDEIVDAGGAEPALYPIDFRGATPTDYDDVAERVKSAFGRLDGIVHCAAAL